MRTILITIIGLIIFSAAALAKDAPDMNFETREIQLVCALGSQAVYNEDESFLIRSNLNSRGWHIDALNTNSNGAMAKAYLIGKNFHDGRTVKVFVAAGTEDIPDVESDFKQGGVALHEDISDGILIHKGFRDYAYKILAGDVAEKLIESLKNNPKETLYLTGHKFGGAVAIVTALRLIDMGVDKNRVQVVTFGALAVGNKALADLYADKINLTRIEVKGDVVKKIFAPFGYVQFGEVVTWKPAKNVDRRDNTMAMYLDCAIRNYFDAEGFTFEAGIGENKIDVSVYVAPIRFVKKNFASKDEKYIYSILRAGLTARFSRLTFDDKNYIEVQSADNISDGLTPILAAAKNLGCKYVLVQLVNADRVRDATDNERQVMLYAFLYDVNGMPALMQTSGMSTKDLTVIEAASFAQENLRSKLEQTISGRTRLISE